MMTTKSFFLLGLLMSSTCFAGSAMHKWTDENGKVHYSDQPPPVNVKAQRLKPDSIDGASSGGNNAQKSLAEREASYKKAQLDKKNASVKDEAQRNADEINKANCTTAQQNLRNLQSGMRLAEVNEKGERVQISDERRAAEIDKTQKDIASFCK